MKLLQALRERKKKKLRHLELSEEAWRQIGEIYSYILVNRKESVSNEDIIETALKNFHNHVVRKGGLNR
ncbi:hypothetical protein MOE90_21095 [Bacillus spizizenii]|nr:hypothetical protein [Bacillus spizizenii]MCY9124991.1 hypothetical protein [Bacillus spizizenii]